MNILLAAFTFAAGLLNSVQSGTNATLGRSIEPVLAGLCSVLSTAVLLALYGAITGRLSLASLANAGAAPWWAWTGGLFGAVLILSQLLAAEQLGSAVFIGLLVTASVAMSILLDHFGLAGYKPHPASWPRIAGAVLMFAGLGLIARF